MQKIGVVGSGQMGNGIAQVFAQNGYEVFLVDVDQQALNTAMNTINRNVDRLIQKGMVEQVERSTIIDRIQISTNL
ncbi:MAG: NAD(P)-binding domain-containing protein, partial [Saprospiraceae bacterium]|nr:NAD(P)-binding domain-containing protein [Saprospiraceae bacterium]